MYRRIRDNHISVTYRKFIKSLKTNSAIRYIQAVAGLSEGTLRNNKMYSDRLVTISR